MAKRMVIDPVTRLEGHLRVEVELEGNKVVDAWCSGTMFRGLEQILQGRGCPGKTRSLTPTR